MTGYKYGAPSPAATIYRVTESNPIIDTERNMTLYEAKDRLEKLKEVIEFVPEGYERNTVIEEIQKLERFIMISHS